MSVLAQAIAGGMSGGPLAPVWFVAPLAILALLAVGAHVVFIDKADMPASRKRLRTVNGILMMFTIPLAAYAFGIATPQRPRAFVMAWMIVAGLVTLVLLLAIADLINTWWMNRKERLELQDQITAAKAAVNLLSRQQAEQPMSAQPPRS